MFRHTPKAVRAGCYADRLYLVVAADGPWMIAWKIDPVKDLEDNETGLSWAAALKLNKWRHPAFKRPMSLANIVARGNIMKGKNGSDPTACFRIDSFYTEVPIN